MIIGIYSSYGIFRGIIRYSEGWTVNEIVTAWGHFMLDNDREELYEKNYLRKNK